LKCCGQFPVSVQIGKYHKFWIQISVLILLVFQEGDNNYDTITLF